MSNNLFIIDKQDDRVLSHINKKYVINNEHEKDLPTHKDYFRFTVLAENKHAEHLNKRNGLIVPGEDGEFLEFRIFESIKHRNNEGLFIEVHALATYLDLKNQKVFDPHKTSAETAVQHANLALAGTEWQVGQVDFKGTRTLTFDNPFNSYDYILRIAREFELEPRFYIETDGNEITGRYVDLVERIGEFRGRTIEFGRDLQSIERKEDTSEVVTALWVYGPQREDGTRLKVFVEDNEARQRWGRRGQHIIDYYEPQTDDQNITESRLRTLGEMELSKRINAVVTYEADIVDLENVPGMENKKIRFGDTIRIKDTKFNPPLYLEARVFNVKRDVFNKSKKTVQLGDFVEYTEEEAQAIWKLLQQQIQQKISAVQAEQMIEEYAEPKKVESPTPPPIEEGENPIWIDTSKEPNVAHVADFNNNKWVKITPTEAEEVNAPSRNETIIEGENYNGLKWSASEGLIVERLDGEVRSVLNGTEGIKVQQKVSNDWTDVFYVDQNGNVKFAGGLEGATGTFTGRVEVDSAENKIILEHGVIRSIGKTSDYDVVIDEFGVTTTDRSSFTGRTRLRPNELFFYGEEGGGVPHAGISYFPYDSGMNGDMAIYANRGEIIVYPKNNFEINTSYGYGRFGARNATSFHMDTDRARFYMYKPLTVAGVITGEGGVTVGTIPLTRDGNGRLSTGGNAINVGNIYSYQTYTTTTSSAANVVITGDYQLARSTSSIKYKKDIEDLWESEYMKVLQLRPVLYKDKETNADSRPDFTRVGLIAEEVHEVEPRLVQYRNLKKKIIDEEGNEVEVLTPFEELEPDGVQYDRIAVYLLPIVRKHEERLRELERMLS